MTIYKEFTDEEKAILESHVLWLEGSDKGKRADFSGRNLSNKDFSGRDLCDSDFRLAILDNCNFETCKLFSANFRAASMENVNLKWTNIACANFTNSDLSFANFEYAYATNANFDAAFLHNANFDSIISLYNAIGNSKEIKTIQTDTYNVVLFGDNIQIGCKKYTISEWESFEDESIIAMDGRTALKWWNEWKDIVLGFAKANVSRETCQ